MWSSQFLVANALCRHLHVTCKLHQGRLTMRNTPQIQCCPFNMLYWVALGSWELTGPSPPAWGWWSLPQSQRSQRRQTCPQTPPLARRTTSPPQPPVPPWPGHNKRQIQSMTCHMHWRSACCGARVFTRPPSMHMTPASLPQFLRLTELLVSTSRVSLVRLIQCWGLSSVVPKHDKLWHAITVMHACMARIRWAIRASQSQGGESTPRLQGRRRRCAQSQSQSAGRRPLPRMPWTPLHPRRWTRPAPPGRAPPWTPPPGCHTGQRHTFDDLQRFAWLLTHTSAWSENAAAWAPPVRVSEQVPLP